ncbi:hypothetical protein GCM10009718_19540 [Isoptericola halotolerans]|uniref:Htaa domain-containing protein n=1 Tax=Isoptericola halotolerans TaxID=300560 RepID=A0ABX2A976_9MICO|nr:hypothetical protein [Isoptericola halotolerans]NOV98462.1 hypothetical protein [Isoptericola halotolerans]
MTRTGRLGAVLLAVGLALGATSTATASDGDDLGPPQRAGGDVTVTVTVPERPTAATLTNAELRWSVNPESVGANFYGGCNFLMAGRPGDDGDAGGSFVWGAGDSGLYRAAAGKVSVVRPGPADEPRVRYATRCQAPDGTPLSMSAENTSGAEVVVVGGKGVRDDDGSLDVSWSGTFSVVYYGGLSYWWATDPRLVLDARGDGRLTAVVGGFGTDMADQTKWVPLRERRVSLATFTGGRIDASGLGGTLAPDWCGVDVLSVAGDQLQRDETNRCWGAFPRNFVAFQQETGLSSYWYTSGGIRDRFKPPSPVAVSFDASRSVGSPTDDDPGGPGPGGPGPGGGTVGPGATGPDATGTGTDGSPGPAGTVPSADVLAPATSPAAGLARDGVAATRALGAPGLFPPPVEDPFVLFPAGAAATLGGGTQGLVPELPDDGPSTGELLAYGITALATGTAATVLGFRRGWLVLPFT